MGKKGRNKTTEDTKAEKAARERGYGEGFREGARSVADKAARELRKYSDD